MRSVGSLLPGDGLLAAAVVEVVGEGDERNARALEGLGAVRLVPVEEVPRLSKQSFH